MACIFWDLDPIFRIRIMTKIHNRITTYHRQHVFISRLHLDMVWPHFLLIILDFSFAVSMSCGSLRLSCFSRCAGDQDAPRTGFMIKGNWRTVVPLRC